MRSLLLSVCLASGLPLSVLPASVPASAEAGKAAPLVLSGLGKGAVPLDGPWQFHTGDSRDWADPSLDDSGWDSLPADRPWGAQGYAGYSGIAWYRRHIVVKPASAAISELSILLPDVEQAYEVYWNGELIGRCGKLPPHPVWDYRQQPHIFRLPAADAGVLAVRVWRAPPLSDEDPGMQAGFMSPPLLGTPETIAAFQGALKYKWLNGQQFLFTLSLMYALAALLSALIWFRYRDQSIQFWLAGFTAIPPLNVLLLEAGLPIPYTVCMGLDQPLLSIRNISLWYLLLWLLDLRSDARLWNLTRRLAWLSLGVNIADGIFCFLVGMPEWARLAQTGDAIATVLNGVLVLFPLVIVILALKKHERFDRADTLVAFSAFLLEMTTEVRDLAAEGIRYTHWNVVARTNGPLLVLGGSPISLMDLLEILLFASLMYAAYASFSQHRKRQIMLEQEMKSASELQRAHVPDAVLDLPGYRLSSAFVPAQEVGGDFFQILPAGGSQSAAMIVLGDVSGKGLKAAMSVSFIVGAIRGLVSLDLSPAHMLEELNQRLMGRLGGGFITCVVVRVEKDGRCAVATAGHPGPFIDDQEVELGGSLPLGMVEGAQYEETVFQVRPGQTCTLFTDGLLEARSSTGELYGYERLTSLCRAGLTADTAARAGVEFGQDDDITVVTFTRLAPGAFQPADEYAHEGESKIGTGEAPAAVTG